MTADQATELMRSAILLSLIIGLPVMLTAVIVGLAISIFQAVTQLQDQTLSFVPKIIAMMAVLLFVLPWTLEQVVQYSHEVFENVAPNLTQSSP